MDAKKLRTLVDGLFRKRSSLMNLWQELAENFYPERAEFNTKRTPGDEWAAHLTTSFPILCRRDLADQVGAMLRNTSKEWFGMALADDSKMDNDGKKFLEWSSGIMRRAMYDGKTHFKRAMKQGDQDYVTFGQTVTQIRLNKSRDSLLYRCHHIASVVWMEDEDGNICLVARKYKAMARDMVQAFGDRAHSKVHEAATKNPFEEFECYHIMVKSDMYDGEAKNKPWFSITYDAPHDHLMEAVAQWAAEYIIERWQTVSGSQYAYSPATIVALPDGRLLQAMTYTLLQAGEKVVDPPLVATENVVRSDMAIYAGGVTWIDRDYDERMGEALRPMTIDSKGMPLSRDMQDDLRQMLMRCFYLNKLSLPQSRPSMTAFEVGQYVQQYIRDAMPLFEPMEDERNGQICEATFDLLMRAGAFGGPTNIPKSLQGADVKFAFRSPLHEAVEEMKGHKFLEMSQMIAGAVQLDPRAAALPDVMVALRDALRGTQVPEAWIKSKVVVEDEVAAQKAAQESADELAAMQQSSEVVKNLGDATNKMAVAA